MVDDVLIDSDIVVGDLGEIPANVSIPQDGSSIQTDLQVIGSMEPVAVTILDDLSVVSYDVGSGGGGPRTANTVRRLRAASSHGVLRIPVMQANAFLVTLTENVTSFILDGAPLEDEELRISVRIKQAANASYAVTMPVGVEWPYGSAPIVSQAHGAEDIFVFVIDTVDGVTQTRGAVAGQSFP